MHFEERTPPRRSFANACAMRVFGVPKPKNMQFRCKHVTQYSFLKIESEKAAFWPKGINISNLDLIGTIRFHTYH
jgi:hypothetical protein